MTMQEKLAWYRFQVLTHDNIPHGQQALFRIEWDKLYAALGHPWTDDPASGAVFLEGSGNWISVLLPGTAHFKIGKSIAHIALMEQWRQSGKSLYIV